MLGAQVLLGALSSAAAGGADPVGPSAMGFPVVVVPGGWARYQVDSRSGPQLLVVRVGKADADGREPGRWLSFEYESPGMGRVELQMLVVGKTLSAPNVRRVRVAIAGKQQPESKPQTRAVPKAVEKKLMRKSRQTIANRKLVVEEYEIGGGEGVGWSPEVPGTGLVYVEGIGEMHLVAFGVGADPWVSGIEPAAQPSAPSGGR